MKFNYINAYKAVIKLRFNIMTKRTLITFMLTKLSIEINSFENIDFCNNSTNILNNTMNSV
jgi:hypothetical protein